MEGEGSLASGGARAGGVYRTPCNTSPRTDGDAATSEEQQTEDGPQSARGFPGAPAPSSQESGAKMLAPQETHPHPRSAVTQPRCPQPAELGTDCGSLETPALHSARAPPLRPDPSGWSPRPSGSSWQAHTHIDSLSPLREELSSQDQAGAGPRQDSPAPPPTDTPPPPEVSFSGPSLTSRGFDVKGRVPVRGAEKGGRRGGGRAAAPPAAGDGGTLLPPSPGSAPAPWL